MIARTVAVVAVNEAVLAELAARYRLPALTVVVHSCSPRWTPPPVPEDRIRTAAGIPPDAPVVLCHGGFRAGRGIEETAAALALPGFETVHLVFLGRANDVVAQVQASFPDPARVHVLPVVPPDEVVAWVAGADVDVMVLLPIELNHVVSTPNKLFESIAAGVPVVSSDFPARRAIIVDDPEGPLGEVCDPTDPIAIAAALRRILGLDPTERAALRTRILRAAHERWNWETESARLVALYRTLAETAP